MVTLVAARNEDDLITTEGPRVLTTLNINFPNSHGQVTLQSVLGSG